MPGHKNRMAITELKLDPTFRIIDKELSDMTKDELTKTLFYKGVRLPHSHVDIKKIVRGIEKIEDDGYEAMPSFFIPIPENRYLLRKEIFYLRDRGYITDVTVSDTHISEAYEALISGEDIHESNRCLGNKRVTALTATPHELDEFESMGFESEEDFKRYSAIYEAYVIKRLPRDTIKEKFGIEIREINEAIKKIRNCIPLSTAPLEDIVDSIEESTSILSMLHSQLENAQKALNNFDKESDTSYKNFLHVYTDKNGNAKVIINSIAKERASLLTGVVKLVDSIRCERERELELRQLLTGAVSKDEKSFGNTEEKGTLKRRIDDLMDEKSFDYARYLSHLPEAEQIAFNTIMDKLFDLHLKDIDGCLNVSHSG
jgi:hypothetical protein